MLEPFIKNYAYSVLNIGAEYLDEVADASQEDAPVWTVAFDDYIVRISEFEKNDETYVSCLACLEKPEPDDRFKRIKEISSSLHDIPAQYAETVLCCDKDKEILCLTAYRRAAGLTEASFNGFMQTFTNALLHAVHPENKNVPSRQEPDEEEAEALKQNMQFLQNYCTKGGFDFEQLSQNFMRIQDDSHAALVGFNIGARHIILSSRILDGVSDKQALEILSVNLALQGENYADLRSDNVFFNTVIDCDAVKPEDFTRYAAVHFAMGDELASQLNKLQGSQSEFMNGMMNNFIVG